MNDEDIFYFQRRAKEELDAALRTVHPKARQAHFDLADLYSGLASALIGVARNKDHDVLIGD